MMRIEHAICQKICEKILLSVYLVVWALNILYHIKSVPTNRRDQNIFFYSAATRESLATGMRQVNSLNPGPTGQYCFKFMLNTKQDDTTTHFKSPV